VRTTLDAGLCIRNFPSQTVERHNKPEIEVKGSKELLLNPITICRTSGERTLIEPSVNSVRVSLAIKQADEIEEVRGGRARARSTATSWRSLGCHLVVPLLGFASGSIPLYSLLHP